MLTSKEILDKFIAKHSLTEDEYVLLLGMRHDEAIVERLRSEAVKLRKKHYENKVFTRGLIEFTNYCKNNCYYCGIRRDNKNIERYRMSKEEILDCCKEGYELGFRTFVLQGGEDPFYTDEMMVDIIRSIKKYIPDCILTLSVGEKTFETYKKYKDAGADRYLLRHETACEKHYAKLHPLELSLENRKQCLFNLKELGFMVGAGFMVGSPYQTDKEIAKDLMFLQELKPEMVGMGPFIPHKDTCFKDEPQGSLELTLFLLTVIRIMLPDVLLPATTALGTIAPDGREQGILNSANVLMPNLSPTANRKKYALYDNKICTGDESAQCKDCLSRRVASIGYTLDNSI